MTKERAVGKTIKFAIAPPCYLFWHFYVPKWTQCFVWKIWVWEGVTARQKVLIKSNKNKKFNTPSIEVPCKQQCGAIGPNSTVHITQCFRKEMEDLPRDPEKKYEGDLSGCHPVEAPRGTQLPRNISLPLSWNLISHAFGFYCHSNWSRKHKVKEILAKNNTEKKQVEKLTCWYNYMMSLQVRMDSVASETIYTSQNHI